MPLHAHTCYIHTADYTQLSGGEKRSLGVKGRKKVHFFSPLLVQFETLLLYASSIFKSNTCQKMKAYVITYTYARTPIFCSPGP